MSLIPAECEELRVSIERLRTMLETLVVRGLRACGGDEVAQLQSYADHLEQAGAAHVAAVLKELRDQIERDDRGSARTLLKAQTSVRVLERLLTLRIVKGQFQFAMQADEAAAAAGFDPAGGEADANSDDDDDDDEEDGGA